MILNKWTLSQHLKLRILAIYCLDFLSDSSQVNLMLETEI